LTFLPNGVCKDVQHPAVLYELMSNGSLYKCIMGKTRVWTN